MSAKLNEIAKGFEGLLKKIQGKKNTVQEPEEDEKDPADKRAAKSLRKAMGGDEKK